jgi:hypothetical protein
MGPPTHAWGAFTALSPDLVALFLRGCVDRREWLPVREGRLPEAGADCRAGAMTSSDISDTPTAERYDEGSAETFALEALESSVESGGCLERSGSDSYQLADDNARDCRGFTTGSSALLSAEARTALPRLNR